MRVYFGDTLQCGMQHRTIQQDSGHRQAFDAGCSRNCGCTLPQLSICVSSNRTLTSAHYQTGHSHNDRGGTAHPYARRRKRYVSGSRAHSHTLITIIRSCGVIDEKEGRVYFRTSTAPQRIVTVDLVRFQRMNSTTVVMQPESVSPSPAAAHDPRGIPRVLCPTATINNEQRFIVVEDEQYASRKCTVF